MTLTDRQREVLLLLADGLARKEAASVLHLSIKTVDYHLRGIRKRLGFDQVALRTRWAIRQGWIVPLLIGCMADAASVQLRWHPSPDSSATGYAVYYGQAGTGPVSRIDVGNVTNAPVTGLQPCLTYFFYVTAYDADCRESDPSNVLDYQVPETITVTAVVESSGDLIWWTPLLETAAQITTTNLAAFYRARMETR